MLVGELIMPRFESIAPSIMDSERWVVNALVGLAGIRIVVGSIAVAAAVRGGVWGLISGELLIFSLILTATAAARRSKIGYIASMVPLVLLAVALDVISFTLTRDVFQPVVVCVCSALVIAHNHRAAVINRNLTLEAEEARGAAEASTAAKSSFVATVSHELRTPLSGILAGASELSAVAPDAKCRNNASLIVQAAEMMRSLLNDLLDLSKIEAGRMSVETVQFDLRGTILETVQFWRPELRRKNLYLHLKGARALPRWVEGDPTRLRQILNNLFSNATKFTRSGGVTLSLSAAADGGREQIIIKVIDTGPGMNEAQQGRLFTAFEQVGSPTSGATAGTGLGLNISREFARLMGGDITVCSEPGKGSCFEVIVFFAISEPAPVEEIGSTELPSRIRLLIVDDHQVNRHAFSLVLEPFADEIVCAEDGDQALEMLRIQAFDLVLMDINMPRLNGRDAVRMLRALPGPNQNVPVIALTGSTSPADIQSYMEAGVNAVATKPLAPAELLASMAQVMDAQSSSTINAPDRCFEAAMSV